MRSKTSKRLTRVVFPSIVAIVLSSPALAHCDSLDGPVIQAARRALDARDPAFALPWVQAKDEPEIRAAFERTLAVRGLSAEARTLADRYFFETLVRVHRAGEGEPFTGLKPAGLDRGPAILAADKAVEQGAVDPVARLLTDVMRERLRERFEEVVRTRGRAHVKAYVEFVHYVERVYAASMGLGRGHLEDAGQEEHR